jgi:hypothetical protein
MLYKTSRVVSVDYLDEGVEVVAIVDDEVQGQLKEYIR